MVAPTRTQRLPGASIGRTLARRRGMGTPKIFLLSPANAAGKRAAMLYRKDADFELARRLRRPEGAPLGEVFAFVSGLYFRGKLAYARRFGTAAPDRSASLVITTARGLLPSSTTITLEELEEFGRSPIDQRDPRYSTPLAADATRLRDELPDDAQVVLLGSIATSKYVELLLEILGDRLCFPERFVGMGDMQRGAAMLRAAESGVELPYVTALGAVRSRAAKKGSGSR